jgi:hypothetical protein
MWTNRRDDFQIRHRPARAVFEEPLMPMPIPGEWERRNRPRLSVTPYARSADAIGDESSPIVQGGRARAPWTKVSLVGVSLLGAALLAMWTEQGPPRCAASFEAPRQLQLSRTVDREHLAADSASATRTARRYIASDAATAPRQQRFLECEALLVHGIATTHGVSVDQVRASGSHAQ